MKDKKVKQVLSRSEYHWWWWGRHKERVREGKYGRSTLYSCMKIEQ
jgi:hypothetical protein